ncbi:MAG TPA: serine hydrolase [Chitinophagaceae bacterium]|nr:serine hydrolase [Chitinophagaceae bacterium]
MLVRLVMLCFLFSLTNFSKAQFNADAVNPVLMQNKKQLGNEAVLMVYKDGKVIYKKKTDDYYDERAQTPIGSASSWLTAVLIMQYIENGTISLDTKIADYIPIYIPYLKKYITIGHCLAQLTGIDFKKGASSSKEASKFNSLEEMVNSYAKKEIRANTGSDFWYAEMHINIAARVIEVITKKKFEQLISKNVIKPLGMKGTSFSPSGGGCPNPAAGAVSTANDFANFLSMIMNKGMFNGKQILKEETINTMLTVTYTPSMVTYMPKAAENFEYGLGAWILEKDINNKPAVFGTTNFEGIWCVIDKCRNYGMILFTKKELSDARKDVFYTLKNVIDEQLPPTNGTSCNN